MSIIVFIIIIELLNTGIIIITMVSIIMSSVVMISRPALTRKGRVRTVRSTGFSVTYQKLTIADRRRGLGSPQRAGQLQALRSRVVCPCTTVAPSSRCSCT